MKRILIWVVLIGFPALQSYAQHTHSGGADGNLVAGIADGTISSLAKLAAALCGTDQLLLDAGGSWSCVSELSGGDAGAGTTRPAGSFILKLRSHNTDCTTITDGKANEFCIDEDDGAIWGCVPSAGDCDTAGEWKRRDDTGAGGGDPVLIDGVGVADASGVDLQSGAGIAITFNSAASPDTASFATASGETGFLASGALTCGAGTAGKIQVHTTPLQYCDNAATPALQWAAYADAAGAAVKGNSGTAFFNAGAVDAAFGGTGDNTSASTGVPRIAAGNWTYDAGLSHLAGSTSADLAGVLSDETGTGAACFATSPALAGDPTVPTAAANDSDTSAASTAYVQGEINGSGGRSLTCTSGSCDADAELYTNVKCINIDPAAATTDWFFWRAETAITVTGIDCIVDAATSVVLTLRECDANGGTCGATEAAITCATTNTTESAGIDDAAVDAGDWMRVLRGTVTGSPAQAVLCFSFTWND